jgi:bis(5'-nucleosidyl)-tetraphosphatase
VVDQDGDSWSLPKGHVEESESDIEVAEREIYEESGIDHLKLIKRLGEYQRFQIGKDWKEKHSEFKTIVMFMFSTDQQALSPVDSNNQVAVWVEKEKVADLLTHPKDKEFFLSIINEI